MNERFLMWGLASIAFVVTLGISSWRDGLWPSDETRTRSNRTAALALAEPAPLPTRPFGPRNPTAVVFAPAVAAVTPQPRAEEQQPPTPAPAEIPPPSVPIAVADVDEAEFLAHRDRAEQHSSRAR